MNILVSQSNPRVGNFKHNLAIVTDAIYDASRHGCDLVVTPEFSLCGYPPEDLLYRLDFYEQLDEAMREIQAIVNNTSIAVLVGLPERRGDSIYNSVAVIRPHVNPEYCNKIALPNKEVFDEKRYFSHGSSPAIVDFNGTKFAILICEDIWDDDVASMINSKAVSGVISVNASPFDVSKYQKRIDLLKRRVISLDIPILYVNMATGQDELIFDGGSFAISNKGDISYLAPFFQTSNSIVTFANGIFNGRIYNAFPSNDKLITDALIFSLKEYCIKNNFKKIFVGLSGGIDSALVITLAVLAMGKDAVCAVMMPTKYTSEISLQDAKELADNLGVEYKIIPIENLYHKHMDLLVEHFNERAPDITEENLQARIRGVILMALANKFGGMVVSTGNKSEMSVGYCTIYGDMVGGFALIKDIYKTLVYELCEYLNETSNFPIPKRIITREPSAELRFDQRDRDSLPPYDILDQILIHHVEMNFGEAKITDMGYSGDDVKRVLNLVKNSEYKRKQSPIGPKITSRAYGRDWRIPVSY